MKLDELIKDPELVRAEKDLNRALEIAEREWENIRVSLRYCGDTGNFSKRDFMFGIIREDVIMRDPLHSPTKSVSVYSPTYYPMYFVRNMLQMDDKLPDVGYRSTEALYAYIELANMSARRLGLKGNLAMGFAAGYGNVRTGWIGEKGWGVERKIFHDIFFEGKKKDYDWEFFWDSVRKSFKNVFDKFNSWKDDNGLYRKETRPDVIVKPNIV